MTMSGEERMNTIIMVWLGAFALFSVTVVDSSWACTAAGKNKHVGVITQVNAADRQFTIEDAETGEPMAFVTEPKLLGPLNIGDRVVVSYEEKDGTMIAKQIK